MKWRCLRLPATLHVSAFFCSLLWFLWAAPASSEQTITLEGWVHTENGQTIPSGVVIRLATAEGLMVVQQSPSSAGQFEFGGLAKIAYHLTVTADGFQPYEQELDLSHSGDKAILTVYLTPLKGTKQASSELPTLTDSKAPRKARKEFEKGERALGDKNFSEARAHFEKAVEEYPCYARAQTDLALALTTQRDRPHAEAALKKAIECDPDFVDAYSQLGWFLNGEKRFVESAAVLQEGLRRSPSAWQFYYQLGVAHYGLGDYNKAEEEYLKTESLNTEPPAEIHVKLADVYFKKSAFAKAYSEMESYLHAEPSGRFAAKIRELMKQLESAGLVHTAQGHAAQPAKR
jgi:tetratricopeptide (TPR) repeat protein